LVASNQKDIYSMTVQLDWPLDVVNRFTEEARRRGLSLDAYLLETVTPPDGSTNDSREGAERRRKRSEAGARILDIQKRVLPDSEGWTSRDYVNFGRR
jgi:hypothetical protein